MASSPFDHAEEQVHAHDPDLTRGSARERTDAPEQHEMGMHALPQAAGNAAFTNLLQRRAAPSGGPPDHGALVRDAMSGGGKALSSDLRQEMEADTGADLSSVRMFSGGKAAEAAAAVQSEAFTAGENIVMGAGHDDTSSPEGKHRVRHEVEHVLQQRAGAVSATDTGTGVAVSDPSDSFEQAAEGAAVDFSQRSASDHDSHAGHDHAD